MRIVLNRPGKLDIQYDEPEIPVPENFIKTRVLVCAVCRTDAKMWEQGHRDLVLPRVLGHELVVQDDQAQKFVVWPGKSCGQCHFCHTERENLCDNMKITGFHMDGGFADTAVLPEKSLIPIPEELQPHMACFAEPVGCVINAFEKLDATPGNSILIIGGGTMGLITALYAQSQGLLPFILEKNAAKIDRITPFLHAANLACAKETQNSEFNIVINACADYTAFCLGIVKVAKGGHLSFFSGITKNEHIETNLLNLLHYKEVTATGVYGMTRPHMEKAIPFMLTHAKLLEQLIEKIIPPEDAPGIMSNVLSGRHLKYILDFSGRAYTVKKTNPKKQDIHRTAISVDPGPTYSAVLQNIEPLSDALLPEATTKIDNKTKPPGSLGRLESLAIQLCQIQDSLNPKITRKSLFVFAGDHGVTEEGVSAFPSEVTPQMVENFLNGGAAINVLCRHHNIDMNVVDMGVNYDFASHKNLIHKKVAYGTKNFALEPAMSGAQMIQALENGMATFLDAYEKDPIDIVGLGEMGIGNTTSAAAIICAITGLTPSLAAGRGTGVDDKGLEHKINVLERVLALHQPDPANGFDILQTIGGYEIAGITGAVLAAASKKCAVVLDGVISTAAGLIAYVMEPDIRGYLISGHKSVEPSQKAALSFMKLNPIIDLDMRLGEGTGAALAMDIADAACKIMCEMASFDDAKVARSSI